MKKPLRWQDDNSPSRSWPARQTHQQRGQQRRRPQQRRRQPAQSKEARVRLESAQALMVMVTKDAPDSVPAHQRLQFHGGPLLGQCKIKGELMAAVSLFSALDAKKKQ